MAGTTLTTTGSATAGPESTLQSYFDKKLLEQTLKTIVLDQFAFKAPLPAKAGAKTVRFFRYPESATTDVATLTEGTAIATGASKQLSMETVDVSLAQYGH